MSQVYKDSYTKEFPCIKSSGKGPKFVYCEFCRSHFTISHGGKYDITRHLIKDKHLENAKLANVSEKQKLDKFFKEDNQSAVIRAELFFTRFLVEHNVPIAAADHAGPLFRKMFPKSDVAKQYGCARTKTTAIVKEMASTAIDSLKKQMRIRPFSVACDGSNDSDHKLYPIVITYFNPAENLVENNLLSLPTLIGSGTGENISNLILKELKKMNIPFENCLSFMADNAYVMQGKKIGAVAFLKQNNKNLISLGCACHLINLAAEKGAAALPVNIDDFLVDIFYYLEKSAKRKESLKQFQLLHDKETKKILKHVCTRWLSLGRSLNRLVDQWDPLLSFFTNMAKSQNNKISSNLSTYKIPKKKYVSDKIAENVNSTSNVDMKSAQKVPKNDLMQGSGSCSTKRKISTTDINTTSSKKQKKEEKCQSKPEKSKSTAKVLSREEKIFMFLSSSEMKAYALFLLNVIPIFDRINVTLQSSSPLIHKLRDLYLELLKELLCRFIKPSVIIENPDLCAINFRSKENQKELHEITIGISTKEEIEKLNAEKRNTFLNSILNYHIAACDYVVKKFPIENAILKHAAVADLSRLGDFTFCSVTFFSDLFPCILNVKPDQSKNDAIDLLEKQFCNLQIDTVLSNFDHSKRMDIQWVEISQIKGATGFPKYKELSDVMLSILSIPHSNAECERIFSIVKKNRNEFRSGLSNETLESLMILKTYKRLPCHEHTFSSIELNNAKKATAASLNCKVQSTE